MVKTYKCIAISSDQHRAEDTLGLLAGETHYNDVKRKFFELTQQPDIIFAAILVAESTFPPSSFRTPDRVSYDDLKWQVEQRWVPEMGKLEEIGYYVAIVDEDGGSVFEGTLDQYDNSFGIAIGATEEQCQDHAKAQGWSLFRKLA